MDDAAGIRLRDFRWALLLVAASWLFAGWLYLRLPASVPVHWNLQGQADRYGSRVEATLIVPAIATLMVPLCTFLPRLDPRRANYPHFRSAYVWLATGIVGFMVGVQAIIAAQLLGARVDLGRLIPAGIGMLFAGIGLVLPHLHPNWFAGIRTPWTLEDDRVWEQTHRFASKLFVVAGVVVALAALVLRSDGWMVGVMGAGIAAAALGSVVYSYVAYRRLHPAGR